MTHIILENCIKCKYTDCVEVCPVDCFHEGINFLVINPEICIDCSICLPECPVEAIITDENIDKNNIFKKLNLELSKLWPILTKKLLNTTNQDKWKLIKNKLHLIKF